MDAAIVDTLPQTPDFCAVSKKFNQLCYSPVKLAFGAWIFPD